MPMSMTHTYIAKDVYKELKQSVKEKITKDNINDYLVYSKGFDIILFYMDFKHLKKSNKIRNLGPYCHGHKTNQFLINLTEKVKKTKDINQFLYLIGLITHYVADSTIHPFVNYKAKKMARKPVTQTDCHFQIETYIDNYLINKRESGDYRKFKVYEKGCFTLTLNDEIKDLLDESFKEVFKVDNMAEYYDNALKHMYRFL